MTTIERQMLLRTVRQARLMWMAMCASVGIYIGLAVVLPYILHRRSFIAVPPSVQPWLTLAFAVAAVLLVGIMHMFNRNQLQRIMARVRGNDHADAAAHSALQALLNGATRQFVGYETVALLGLILFFMTGRYLEPAIFWFAAVAL